MKATLEEKRTWVRMGWELAALEKLAIDILSDGDYQAIMSKAAMSGLARAVDGPDLFYGSGLNTARAMVGDFREKLAAEATTRGDQLYNLTEGAEHGG